MEAARAWYNGDYIDRAKLWQKAAPYRGFIVAGLWWRAAPPVAQIGST